MQRTHDMITLGTASIETRGPRGDYPDVGIGQQKTGLTDD